MSTSQYYPYVTATSMAGPYIYVRWSNPPDDSFDKILLRSSFADFPRGITSGTLLYEEDAYSVDPSPTFSVWRGSEGVVGAITLDGSPLETVSVSFKGSLTMDIVGSVSGDLASDVPVTPTMNISIPGHFSFSITDTSSLVAGCSFTFEASPFSRNLYTFGEPDHDLPPLTNVFFRLFLRKPDGAWVSDTFTFQADAFCLDYSGASDSLWNLLPEIYRYKDGQDE